MAKKKADKPKQPDLPEIKGEGVAPVSIPDIDKAINTYERKKEKRCEASPDEVAAKRALKELLASNRERLPVNEDGHRFYRYEGVDYILDEVMKRRKTDDGSNDDE